VSIPRAAIEQALVIPLPEGVDPQAATLAEPLSCVVAAQRAARIDPGDTVVIYGAGPMGQLHVMLAATSGAGRIIVADKNADRLALARTLGAADTVNVAERPVGDWAREHAAGGVNVVIIAVPVPEIQAEAMEILAPLGRLCLFAGWPRGTAGVALDTNAIHYKSLVVTDLPPLNEATRGARIRVWSQPKEGDRCHEEGSSRRSRSSGSSARPRSSWLEGGPCPRWCGSLA